MATATITHTITKIPEVTIFKDTRTQATKKADGTLDLRFEAHFQDTPVAVELTLPSSANPPAILRAGTTVRLSATTVHESRGNTVVRAKRGSTRERGQCGICHMTAIISASLDSPARAICAICAQEQAFNRNDR